MIFDVLNTVLKIFTNNLKLITISNLKNKFICSIYCSQKHKNLM